MSIDTLAPPQLQLYRLHPAAMQIRPAGLSRQWMDATSRRFAYRCTPLNIANTSGWEVLTPVGFDVEWDGGRSTDAIRITPHDPSARIQRSASSHFGHGVLTFHLGWLLRTNPGWAVWARGLPNRTKRSITPLEGIVETDWLTFPFTMNWRFVEKGRVRFAAGEPIAYLTIFPHMAIDQVLPTFHEIQDAPALHTAFMDWRDSRNDWNTRLAEGDPAVTKQGWQRKYLRGAHAAQTGAYHVVKRRLNAPVAGLASGCPVSHRCDDSTSTTNCAPEDGLWSEEVDG
ncbi:DUF6065 family protein [Xanthomonas prunicola]|jgi:hypothetical protein|uniref:DUF6065 family protein n=1 Tax=Xanthomonas prunicola TaxID=2053930 RepID=UPI001055BC6F|nr:DUF6065 family protein [Xanthomonas prunicola]